LDAISFPAPGTVINRKRIPVVIGNPASKANVDSVTFSYTEMATVSPLEQPYGKIDKEDSVEFSVLGTGFRKEFDSKHNSSSICEILNLPKPAIEGETTLQVIFKHNGKPAGCTYFPIKGKKIGKDTVWYELANPTQDFSDKIIQYRKQLYRSKNQPR
jgi:hypothetical protein